MGATDAVEVTCGACGTRFAVQYAYQVVALRDETLHVCSMACRERAIEASRKLQDRSRRGPAARIAVLNHKGGTGKTTTSVNLAAGLADRGRNVLLIDCDPQGHVGVSLGIKGALGVKEVLSDGVRPQDVVVPITERLHVLSAGVTLALSEVQMARMQTGAREVMRRRLTGLSGYDYILLDCGPSHSFLNANALAWCDRVLIPVACDYLSMVGVRQVTRSIREANEGGGPPVEILGVLPTFYDARNRISEESVRSLRTHFPDQVPPPIGINTKLREAPSKRRTIFEYAPTSRGALDYLRLVDWVIERVEAGASFDQAPPPPTPSVERAS